MVFFSLIKVSGRKYSVTTFKLPLTLIAKSYQKLSTGTLKVSVGDGHARHKGPGHLVRPYWLGLERRWI